MKKVIVFVLLIACLSVGVTLHHPHTAAAATNNNNLIDDFTFDDTNTLSPSQIDSWLNANFPNSCISTNSGFSAPDPLGYSPDANFVDGHYSYGSAVSAGQAIYDAAVAHGVNPQVLITKLQNEEGLVEGNGPYGCGATAMASAVGYACTDSGTYAHSYTYTGASPYTDSTALATPLYYRNGVAQNSIGSTCVNQNVKAGFSEQLVHAAWLLSFSRHKSEGQTGWASVHGNWNHCEDNATCAANLNIPSGWACYSGYMTQGNLKRCPSDASTTYYDGYASIDGSTIHMDTGPTAALYVYTPHLQSFDTIFNRYFGSQYANDSFTPHPNGTLVAAAGKVYALENGQRRWIMNGYIFDSYHFNWGLIKLATTGDNNLPLGAAYDTLAAGTIFRTDNSPTYVMTYENGSLVKQQISLSAFNNMGYSWDEVEYIPSSFVPSATSSSILFGSQHPAGTLVAGNGKVYLLDQSSKRWIVNGDAFWTNNYNWGNVKSASAADLALPDGTNVDLKQGTMIISNSNIYVVDYDGSGILKRPVGPWECFANRWHYITTDLYNVAAVPSRTGALASC